MDIFFASGDALYALLRESKVLYANEIVRCICSIVKGEVVLLPCSNTTIELFKSELIEKFHSLGLEHYTAFDMTIFIINREIIGRSGEKCDGFALKVYDKYIAVVSEYTDVFSVICHEVCHAVFCEMTRLNRSFVHSCESEVEFLEGLIANGSSWANKTTR